MLKSELEKKLEVLRNTKNIDSMRMEASKDLWQFAITLIKDLDFHQDIDENSRIFQIIKAIICEYINNFSNLKSILIEIVIMDKMPLIIIVNIYNFLQDGDIKDIALIKLLLLNQINPIKERYLNILENAINHSFNNVRWFATNALINLIIKNKIINADIRYPSFWTSKFIFKITYDRFTDPDISIRKAAVDGIILLIKEGKIPDNSVSFVIECLANSMTHKYYMDFDFEEAIFYLKKKNNKTEELIENTVRYSFPAMYSKITVFNSHRE